MKFISMFFIFLGLLSLIFNISHPLGLSGKSTQYYTNFEDRLLFGGIQLLVGVIFYYYGYKNKVKKEKYSICPKCKETFNYSELENGKCKYCEDVDTVELEVYYEKYNRDKEKIVKVYNKEKEIINELFNEKK